MKICFSFSWLVAHQAMKNIFVHFQEQERLRYCQPHKAFTFRQHGYESIVGPVKGDLILY